MGVHQRGSRQVLSAALCVVAVLAAALVRGVAARTAAGRQPPDFKSLGSHLPNSSSQAYHAKSYYNYCDLCRDHTLCRYYGQGQACHAGSYSVSRPLSREDQDAVVAAHNTARWLLATGEEYRGGPGPQPPAANMRLMWYDDELAAVAQRWADQCQFKHDTCRSVERFPVGQNIYLERASRQLKLPDWEAVTNKWFDEVAKHSGRQTYNPYRFTAVTGHFTQVAWATSFLMGCGVSEYTENYAGRRWYTRLYVCNYGPSGNVIGDWMYRVGEACSSCGPESYCYYGLCV